MKVTVERVEEKVLELWLGGSGAAGPTVATIARDLGCSEATVRARLKETLKLIEKPRNHQFAGSVGTWAPTRAWLQQLLRGKRESGLRCGKCGASSTCNNCGPFR